MLKKNKMKKESFTLIELLVVVAIIGILVSILIPSLGKARELSKRTVCLSNLKQMGFVTTLYANGNSLKLNPSRGSSTTNNSLHWLGKDTITGFEQYIENWSTSDCINYPWSTLATGRNPNGAGSNTIGYLYMGGIRTNNLQGPGKDWVAPKFLSDDSKLVIWADRVQTSGSWSTHILHSRSGYQRISGEGFINDLNERGSDGANKVRLDGSAKWTSQLSMTGQKGDSNPNLVFWWEIER